MKKNRALVTSKKFRFQFYIKRIVKKYFIFIVGIVFLLSLIPRSVEVLNGNPVFGFDQGREYLMTKDIFDNKNLTLIGTPIGGGSAGFQGIFHGPIYYYLLGIPYILADGHPNGGTILMFVIGALSLLLAFLLGRKMLGDLGGFFLMLLVGISPLFIAQSRFIWSPYPSTLFILIALYFIFEINKRERNIFFAAFFSTFIYNFELGIAIPMSIGLLIYSLFLYGKSIKPYILLFMGFISGLLPMIFFEIRHNFLGILGMVDYLLRGSVDPEQNYTTTIVLEHTASFVNNFKDTFPLLPFNLISIFSIILLISFIFLLKSEKDKKLKTFLLFIALLPILNFIILSFLRNTIYNYYLYHISLIYLIIFAFCLVRSLKNKILFTILLISLSTMTIFAVVKNYQMVVYDIKDYGGTAKLQGKIDAIDYIYKDAKGKKFGLLVFSPPVYTYPYTYLIEWYGREKYEYVPHDKKEGLFYLLIETDPQKPWSYNGWLETVVKTGKVLDTVTLPSGFIVQKRENNL